MGAFSDYITALISQKGLSMYAVAKKSGADISTITRMCDGTRKPRVDVLHRIVTKGIGFSRSSHEYARATALLVLSYMDTRANAKSVRDTVVKELSCARENKEFEQFAKAFASLGDSERKWLLKIAENRALLKAVIGLFGTLSNVQHSDNIPVFKKYKR